MTFFFNSDKIQSYFNRINYKGTIEPTLATLNALQESHLFHVPFENLDIHYGTAIVLDSERIYHKVVVNNRGGFCYELNGLFHELLSALGFQVERMSGRVYSKEMGYGHEFDHLFNIVTIEGEAYICDVGFGEFSILPLRVELDEVQEDPRGLYILQQHDDAYFRVSKKVGTDYVPEYIFQRKAHPYNAYSNMCLFHQTDPASHFTKKRLISLATQQGRITITGNVLKIRDNEKVEEKDITTEKEFLQLLWELFRVKLSTN